MFEVVSKILFAIIRMIMWAAPLGAFGGMAYTVAQFGGGALSNLALLMVTFWGTCAVFVFGVLGLVARWSGFSIFKFVRLLKDELLIIVGTSSSETVLPRLLAKLQKAGASKQTVGVVLPTGYSFNLDGTCIYLTLGALFITQAAGQSMAIGEQIALCALMVLTSKGAAGITGAGLVDADRLAAGVRRHVLLARVDRRRHRAGGRHRPHHERGPRADELHRQRRGDDGDRQAGRASATRSASRPCSTTRRWPTRTLRRRGAAGRSGRRRRTLRARAGPGARLTPVAFTGGLRRGAAARRPSRVRLRRRRRQRERQRLRVGPGAQALRGADVLLERRAPRWWRRSGCSRSAA